MNASMTDLTDSWTAVVLPCGRLRHSTVPDRQRHRRRCGVPCSGDPALEGRLFDRDEYDDERWVQGLAYRRQGMSQKRLINNMTYYEWREASAKKIQKGYEHRFRDKLRALGIYDNNVALPCCD